MSDSWTGGGGGLAVQYQNGIYINVEHGAHARFQDCGKPQRLDQDGSVFGIYVEKIETMQPVTKSLKYRATQIQSPGPVAWKHNSVSDKKKRGQFEDLRNYVRYWAGLK